MFGVGESVQQGACHDWPTTDIPCPSWLRVIVSLIVFLYLLYMQIKRQPIRRNMEKVRKVVVEVNVEQGRDELRCEFKLMVAVANPVVRRGETEGVTHISGSDSHYHATIPSLALLSLPPFTCSPDSDS
jgi:hypothetical protein